MPKLVLVALVLIAGCAAPRKAPPLKTQEGRDAFGLCENRCKLEAGRMRMQTCIPWSVACQVMTDRWGNDCIDGCELQTRGM